MHNTLQTVYRFIHRFPGHCMQSNITFDSNEHIGVTIMDIDAVSPSIGTPIAECDINTTLVSGLLADQHPDLASMPLRGVEAG